MRTAILLHFDEPATAIQPKDAAGGLADLLVPAGLTAPTHADGIVGGARQWAAAQGFQAAEKTAGQTKLTRSMTVEAIVSVPWKTTNGAFRVIQRGKGGSNAERVLFEFFVLVTGAPGAPVVSLQMTWENSAGGGSSIGDRQFAAPAGAWWYVAASRRWISAGEVAVDYFVNGALIGTRTDAVGDLGNGDGGTTLIGCDAALVGSPAGFLIDEIRVSNEALSAEEIRQIYLSMFAYPAAGYEAMKALIPRGSIFGEVYPSDTDSAVQRELMVEGDALAMPIAKAGELADDFLPDRAWSTLSRWEGVTGQAPAPGDSIATRRTRTVAHLRKVNGYQRSEIVKAVAGLLAMEEADVAIVEHSNTLLDTFPGVTVAPWWTQTPNAGAISVAAGRLTLGGFAAGETAEWTGAIPRDTRTPITVGMPLPEETSMQMIASLGAYTFSESGVAAGIYVLDPVSGNAHLFGLKRQGATPTLWHATIVDGVAIAVTEHVGAVPAAGTLWLRYTDKGGGLADLDYRVGGAADDYFSGWISAFAGVATTTPRFIAGLFLMGQTVPATAGGSAGFDDFWLWCPKSRRSYEWYIYRDPGLPGVADVKGAQQVIDKMKPAHTNGAIVQTLSLLCDDPFSVCDATPLGA